MKRVSGRVSRPAPRALLGPTFLVIEIAHFCCIRPVRGQKCCDFTPGGCTVPTRLSGRSAHPPSGKGPSRPAAFLGRRAAVGRLASDGGRGLCQRYCLRPSSSSAAAPRVVSYVLPDWASFLIWAAPTPFTHRPDGGTAPAEGHGAGDSEASHHGRVGPPRVLRVPHATHVIADLTLAPFLLIASTPEQTPHCANGGGELIISRSPRTSWAAELADLALLFLPPVAPAPEPSCVTGAFGASGGGEAADPSEGTAGTQRTPSRAPRPSSTTSGRVRRTARSRGIARGPGGTLAAASPEGQAGGLRPRSCTLTGMRPRSGQP